MKSLVGMWWSTLVRHSLILQVLNADMVPTDWDSSCARPVFYQSGGRNRFLTMDFVDD